MKKLVSITLSTALILLTAGCAAAPDTSELTARIEALTAQVEALTEQVQKLSVNAGDMGVRESELITKVDDFNMRLSSYSAATSNFNAELSRLTHQINLLRTPIDISDLERVDYEIIDPLIPVGSIWFYSWPTVMDIEADDLLCFLGYNNWLVLPRDWETCYLPDYLYQAAWLVEREIMARFDVTAEYLRTSSLYDAEKNAYTMVGGFGGGWNATAMSVTQSGGYVVIKVGQMYHTDEALTTLPEGTVQRGTYVVTPIGTLTVRIKPDNRVEYISYVYERTEQ